jgi:hypothetical protein
MVDPFLAHNKGRRRTLSERWVYVTIGSNLAIRSTVRVRSTLALGCTLRVGWIVTVKVNLAIVLTHSSVQKVIQSSKHGNLGVAFKVIVVHVGMSEKVWTTVHRNRLHQSLTVRKRNNVIMLAVGNKDGTRHLANAVNVGKHVAQVAETQVGQDDAIYG